MKYLRKASNIKKKRKETKPSREKKKTIYGAILRKLRIKIFQEERENIVSLKQEQESCVFKKEVQSKNETKHTEIKEYGSWKFCGFLWLPTRSVILWKDSDSEVVVIESWLLFITAKGSQQDQQEKDTLDRV